MNNVCNTCGCEIDDDQVFHQSLKNRRFLATVENNEVVQECCEACAQECMGAEKNLSLIKTSKYMYHANYIDARVTEAMVLNVAAACGTSEACVKRALEHIKGSEF